MKIQLGDTAVTLINVCSLRADLANWFGLETWPDQYDEILREPVAAPVQSVLLQRPGLTMLVDAYEYDLKPTSMFALPNYQPPPGLVAQLAALGVQPNDITHVVITHLHFDHYTGVTHEQDGVWLPMFPQAKVIIGRSDWEQAEGAFTRTDSPESQTLAVLQAHDLQELVAGQVDVADGITLLPTPGESPGHQVVRVATAERTLYILGDLYHHELEVEQPQWIVRWADAAEMATSRQALLPELLQEKSVLVAAHIAGFGRLQQTATGLRWQTIPEEEV